MAARRRGGEAARRGPRQLIPSVKGSKYGHGFQIGGGLAGPGCVGHDGGFLGVEAFVSNHPSTGYTLVVLSNYYYDSALRLMEAFPKEFQRHLADVKAR